MGQFTDMIFLDFPWLGRVCLIRVEFAQFGQPSPAIQNVNYQAMLILALHSLVEHIHHTLALSFLATVEDAITDPLVLTKSPRS